MTAQGTFTGQRRRRATRPAVKVADRTASVLISIGGVGTILAVVAVFLFLVWVAAPLFLPAKTEMVGRQPPAWSVQPPRQVGVDEYRVLGWAAYPDGGIHAFRLDDGTHRGTARPFGEEVPTCASFSASGQQAVYGFADGSLRLVDIAFATEFLPGRALPPDVRQALQDGGPGTVRSLDEGVVELTPEGQFRRQTLAVNAGPPVPAAAGAVLRVSQAQTTTGPLVVVLAREGEGLVLRVLVGAEREDFLTGETTFVFEPAGDLPFRSLAPGVPDHLAVSGSGAEIYVAWRDGSLLRVDRSQPAGPFIAETGRLTEPGVELTSLRLLLGATTLVWGDAAGNLRAGFLVRQPGPGFPGLEESWRDLERSRDALAVAKTLAGGDTAVSALAPSSRSRLLLAGFAGGGLRLYNVTNEALLADLEVGDGEPVLQVAFAPKEDGFVAVTPRGVTHGTLDPGHPEASLKALFRPVWYEGYPRPEHVWQSTGGTDDFEPKLGLMPLIFGTVKATFYSMLFGAPLALLAAVFTSEFLHRRTRSVVKPVIELMASLPSVVLGFLAALVIAPFVKDVVASVLAGGFTLPVVFLLGAYLWQLLPSPLAIRLARWRFPLFLGVVAPAGLALAGLVGPGLERLLFAGDIRAWLAWDPANPTLEAVRFESAVGGWFLLCLPICGAAAVLGLQRLLNPPLRRWARERPRVQLAALDLIKFAAGAAAAVLAALAAAVVLDGVGFDPRGGVVGTYVQRNAMVVGFVMGFAIIPIIYTIAEDALSTVPEHLRSASLGAGATPWQTAMRIIVPTAMSGLFSALMIGLGRAAGETMIVLMAAGNTPVMDWNVFSGFRTLSANIAVELPEAVRGSTHYRTLFLAALVLFAMTFVVNTAAELVRLRFRKRAYQL